MDTFLPFGLAFGDLIPRIRKSSTPTFRLVQSAHAHTGIDLTTQAFALDLFFLLAFFFIAAPQTTLSTIISLVTTLILLCETIYCTTRWICRLALSVVSVASSPFDIFAALHGDFLRTLNIAVVCTANIPLIVFVLASRAVCSVFLRRARTPVSNLRTPGSIAASAIPRRRRTVTFARALPSTPLQASSSISPVLDSEAPSAADDSLATPASPLAQPGKPILLSSSSSSIESRLRSASPFPVRSVTWADKPLVDVSPPRPASPEDVCLLFKPAAGKDERVLVASDSDDEQFWL